MPPISFEATEDRENHCDEGNSQIKEPANVNKSGSTPNSNSNGAGIASKSETSGIEASNEQSNKPLKNVPKNYDNEDEPSASYFMVYFVIGLIFLIGGYALYIKRKKVMGVIVEGWQKKERRQARGGSRQPYSRVASESEQTVDQP